ncbi:MAG: Fe-S cluster assembly ATPase SufC [bacterium]
MFKITNLSVNSDTTKILTKINLTIQKGEIHAFMGPNGSGKSTLTKVIMGHPDYQITAGTIKMNRNDLSKLSVTERSLQGIFVAFQYPVEIPGVNFSNYLRLVYNNHQPKNKQLPVFKFRKLLKEKAKELAVPEKLLDRNLNENLSGGEKKKMEILQLALIKPQLAILDEADSGLDLDALKIIFQGIQQIKTENPQMSILLITHYQRVYEFLKPDFVHLMQQGQITKSGGMEIVKAINQHGYHEKETK